MAIKLADTLAPMGDFPAAESSNVEITLSGGAKKSIQEAYEDGDLGGGGSGVPAVETMPASPSDNDVVLYVGENTENYKKGHTYQAHTSVGWESVSIPPLTYFYANNVWTDGTDTYYYDGSEYVDNYRLNKDANPLRWETYDTHNPSNFFVGSNLWYAGGKTYYSYYDNHYVYDRSANRWDEITWEGVPHYISANGIWTDGTNTYYSDGSNQFMIDTENRVWTPVTWSGLASPDGSNIWTDGTDVYYSSEENQYVLNKNTSTWVEKTWHGDLNVSEIYDFALNVWTDGTNTYYSSSDHGHYVLNKSASTWEPKTWNESDFNGSDVWTDGTETYVDVRYRLEEASEWVDITPVPNQIPADYVDLLAD